MNFWALRNPASFTPASPSSLMRSPADFGGFGVAAVTEVAAFSRPTCSA